MASFTCSRIFVAVGASGVAISLAGSGTSWVNGTTVFTVTGGAGASITANTVGSSTTAIITLTVGSAAGTLTISDGTNTCTVAAVVPASNSPLNRSSLIRWLDADAITGIADNAAFTGTLAGFTDSGAGTVFRQGNFLGCNCINFASASSQYLTSSSNADVLASNSGDSTLTFIFQFTGAYGSEYDLFGQSSSATRWWTFHYSSSSPISVGGAHANAGNVAIGNINIVQITYSQSTTTSVVYLNGVQVASATGSVTTDTSALQIGSHNGGSFYQGNIAQVIIDNAVLNSTQLAGDIAYFKARYNATPQTLVFNFGDSRVAGSSANIPTTTAASYPFPEQVGFAFPNATILNCGVGGTTVEQMVTGFTAGTYGGSITADRLSPLYQNIVGVVWSGFNDIGAGNTAAATAVNFIAAVQQLEALPIMTIPCTEPDYEYNPGQDQPYRATYNAAIIAGLPSIPGKRQLCRLDLDPRIGYTGAANSTFYFDTVNSPANIHMTGKNADGITPGGGYGVVAGNVVSALEILTTVAGNGPTQTVLTVTSDGTTPVQGARCYVTSDSSGQLPVTGVLPTNSSGQVTFNLTTGTMYYLTAMKQGSPEKLLDAMAFTA